MQNIGVTTWILMWFDQSKFGDGSHACDFHNLQFNDGLRSSFIQSEMRQH